MPKGRVVESFPLCEGFFNKMAKKGRKPKKEKLLASQASEYGDYGDFMAAKRKYDAEQLNRKENKDV